jgi:uncharacterized protein DUF4870
MHDDSVNRKGAVWSYLGAALVGWTFAGIYLIWLVPLVIRLRAKGAHTREHAAAAVNFGLTVLIAIVVGAVVSVVLGFSPAEAPAPLPMYPVFIYVIVGLVGLLVGAVQTARGRQFTFIRSMSLRLLK